MVEGCCARRHAGMARLRAYSSLSCAYVIIAIRMLMTNATASYCCMLCIAVLVVSCKLVVVPWWCVSEQQHPWVACVLMG